MLYFSTCLIFNQFIYFKLYILGSSPTGNHQLIEQSFSSVLQCDKCHNYLHGLIHQGVVCQGMFVSHSNIKFLQCNTFQVFLSILGDVYLYKFSYIGFKFYSL